MPDLAWNHRVWDGSYDWSDAGEEWSAPWGGSHAQWYGTILPRIGRFVPTGRVLEIAPGYGRWSRFLIPLSEDYIGVDLSEECVASCRKRFEAWPTARFVTNDGKSLDAIGDSTIDLVFSFDSLVHVEMDVLGAYLEQVVTKLAPNGVAFIHHSNMLGAGSGAANPHNRAKSVSSEQVRAIVTASRGRILLQEEIDWDGTSCQDCITVLSRRDAFPDRDAVVLRNQEFMKEAELVRLHQSLYSRL